MLAIAPSGYPYEYISATRNNLLVVLTAYSGGGSGVFYALDILDAAWASAFDDDDGESYQRLDLTMPRHCALGDRWQGEIKISGNSIHVSTTGAPPGQDMKPRDLEARRP